MSWKTLYLPGFWPLRNMRIPLRRILIPMAHRSEVQSSKRQLAERFLRMDNPLPQTPLENLRLGFPMSGCPIDTRGLR